MSRNKSFVIVHVVFATKYRLPMLTESDQAELFKFVKFKLTDRLKSNIMLANGSDDHIHVLIELHPTESISNVVRIIKICSSNYLNKLGLKDDLKLKCQRGFFAESISKERITTLSKYIMNQKEHHRYK